MRRLSVNRMILLSLLLFLPVGCGAGELLGLNPNTLRYRMRKMGIPFGKEQDR